MYSKLRIVVAENSLDLGIRISKYLKEKDYEAYNLKRYESISAFIAEVNQYNPDILIFNINLFYGNVSYLIKEINNNCKPMHLLILIPRERTRLKNSLENDNSNVTCIELPCELYKIHEEIAIKRNFYNDMNISERIEYFIKNIGLNTKLKGFKYICEAIYIILFEGDKFKILTKDIYPEIASRFGSSSSNVERCIRNSMNIFIQNSKNRRHLNDIYLNTDILNDEIKITNSKFLKIIAEAFKIWHLDK